MEALATVGLAGNIVQFIDFSCKLFDQARTIHNSPSGASRYAQDLETITSSLRSLSENLRKIPQSQSRNATSKPRQEGAALKELKELAKGCESVANELITVLQSVRTKNPASKWSSFRASLASMWKEQKINAIKDQLDSYRFQIAMQLQVLQR